MADRSRFRLRNPSLRFRITLSAVAVVGVTLVVAATVFAVVQAAVLDQGVTSRAAAAADRVLAQLEAGATPASAVGAARASLAEDGFVVVQSADNARVLASGGDPAAIREYTAQADGDPGTSMRLGSTVYRLASSGATDRSTPAPTVTVAPPGSEDSGGGRGGGSDDSGGSSTPSGGSDDSGGGSGSGGGSDDSGGGSGSGTGSGSGGTTDDSGGGSGSGGHGSDDAAAPNGRGTSHLVSYAVAAATGSPTGATTAAASDYLVVAGLSTESTDAVTSATRTTLVVAVPLLLLVMGGTTWFVVGRALRPVERMRRQVAGITAAHLSERVPDPGGADEVARLAATLNAMLDRLDASAAAQRRFVSDASHELRSPLAVMRQHAEVAKAYPDRLPPDRLADTVLHEGTRLADLVSAMLVLAKTDEGALPVARDDVDLDDLVGAEAARLRTTGRLRVDASRVTAVRVTGDRGLLAQLLRNLADNAARHATSTVAFELGTATPDASAPSAAVLAVEDDGAGIADADRERVFDRFVRLDEARARESGGSGLGLAIVRGIVEAHGGSVHVERAARGGARFVVTLPRAEPDPTPEGDADA